MKKSEGDGDGGKEAMVLRYLYELCTVQVPTPHHTHTHTHTAGHAYGCIWFSKLATECVAERVDIREREDRK